MILNEPKSIVSARQLFQTCKRAETTSTAATSSPVATMFPFESYRPSLPSMTR